VSDLLILCYHSVSESWNSQISVSPRQFERQLSALAARGYRGATFSDAVLAPPEGRTLVVSFDDAYRSVLDLACPILTRLGFPGTVFAPTAFIGSGAPMSWPGIEQWLGGPHEGELVPMSWPELRGLTEAGWEVGSHTRTHPRLPQLGDADLISELTASRRECEERLERPCRSLAYPYGDHDARVADAARQSGYLAACGVRPLRHRPDPLRRARVGVYRGDGALRFRLKTLPTIRRRQALRAR
jgi:peptidoglycan/xylan/chitin deacetylase (PgdA/CDA1 family)